MNPYIINFSFLSIRWYSFIMLCAILTAVFIIYKEAKREKLPKLFVEDMVFYGIIYGIIGARLYYVIFNWYYYKTNILDIFKIWEGGLAIHGALLAGTIFIIIFANSRKQSVLKVLDMTTFGIILGQAIGRWGNFMNSEAYGRITTKITLIKQGIPRFIIEGMHINGVYYQPTFLYESLWNIVGFITLLLTKTKLKLKVGTLTCIYLVWYGVGRLIVENFRSDSLTFLGLRIAQVVSIVMILVGILGYIYLRNTKRAFYHRHHSNDRVEKLEV